MKLYRFNQFRKVVAGMWEESQQTSVTSDPWYKFQNPVENFRLIQKHDIVTSEKHVFDESMGSLRPHSVKLGWLPNIIFILRKPKPIGTEFNTSVCPKVNIMTHMELCEGKECMLNKPFHVKLDGTAACTGRLAQGTSQLYINNRTELVMGDLWFSQVSCQYKKSVLGPKRVHLPGEDSTLKKC
jgi:hypothetical protein